MLGAFVSVVRVFALGLAVNGVLTGYTWGPLTAQIIKDPVLFWVAFHLYDMTFSPPAPIHGVGGTSPLAGTGATIMANSITKTTTPESATPMPTRSSKQILTAHD